MKSRAFKQVDVFTDQAYFGNPLAVVMDGSDLDDASMQRFACWTNLSETTFLLPPTDEARAAGADYRVRIFTPGGELPFAGHPTLGSCHSWLEAGGHARSQQWIVQQCNKGLVKIRHDTQSGRAARLAFAAPDLARRAPAPAVLAQVAAALGLKPTQIQAAELLDNGPEWLGLLLDSPDTVLGLAPDHAELKRLGIKVGVAALYARTPSAPLIARGNREARAFGRVAIKPLPDVDLEVRAFAAPIGINEDPVTGSLNASLAQWLIADGYAPARYVASQGLNLGRAGQVHIERDADGQVWVGGQTVTCIAGHVVL